MRIRSTPPRRNRVRRSPMRERRTAVAIAVLTACATLAAGGWNATAAPAARPVSPPPAKDTSANGPAYRAWTTLGDAEGFHLLVTDPRHQGSWRTAATLSEPGFETDRWIGNACVTAFGRRAVVAYAPRTFTNKPDLMSRGAFTAVVELTTGKITKLPVQASLAYFSPGCGTGETALLSQFSDERMAGNATRLVAVDTTSGRTEAPLKLAGQVTSAVPYDGDAVAADGNRLVRISLHGSDRGRRTPVALTSSVPFQLRVDRDGGIVYLDRPTTTARAAVASGAVMRISAEGVRNAAALRAARESVRPQELATGALTAMDLTATPDGTVVVTGKTSAGRDRLPDAVRRPSGVLKGATVSLDGRAVVTSVGWADQPGAPTLTGPQPSPGAHAARIGLHDLVSGADSTMEAAPGAAPAEAAGTTRSPALSAPRGGASRRGLAADPHNPVEEERTCAVPRGDPKLQAFQPTPRQVEWAVDQAISNNLNKHVSRPAGWKGLSIGAYRPQDLFPRLALDGGGQIPAQVMLGITAQESNMWQATRFAVPGVTANPLIGNYYGTSYNSDGQVPDPWGIDWSKSDCGYGITQVTDGMRKADTSLNDLQQRAVAVDYTANIAAGVNILAEKWNQTRKAGLTVAGGNPSYLESWFLALWAYNSGFYPQSSAPQNHGKWGVGFTNNPANPLWKANRTPFLENEDGLDDYSHAAHPQDWPYQEKVLGWAARPISALFKPGDMQPGYRAAWWSTSVDRTAMKPPEDLFCDSSNECDPSKIGPNDANKPGQGTCTREDLYCWWNAPISTSKWKNCNLNVCGNAVHRFNDTYPEQADANSYPPRCGTGLPAGALVVDDIPNGMRPAGSDNRGCGTVLSDGTFQFDFAASGDQYPGKIDTHQIGAGSANHFWFTHTRQGTDGARLATTGTWRLGQVLNGWTRVFVHVPDHGAHTQQAKYEIDTGTGEFTRTRYINQKIKANTWVSLGVYEVHGIPRVRLGSQTADGTGSEDVAWDAAAFQPLPGKPQHIVAVLGDSYTSGEGAGDYLPESNADHGEKGWNACRRSKNAWSRKLQLPGTSASLGTLADTWNPQAELGFVACSGAMTQNVGDRPFLPDRQSFGEGQFHEINQVNSGVLSQDTTLVMLTLGGNDDNGFADAMLDCSGIGKNCNDDDGFLPKYKGIIDNSMIPNLETVLTDIKSRAGNAQIVLMGYPELLSRTEKCAGSFYYMMPEVKALAELVNYADAKQRALTDRLRAGGTHIAYADPVQSFVGHSGCDDPEWINKVVIGPNGDGDFHQGDPVTKAGKQCTTDWLPEACISRESFHPKSAGTTGYAAVMRTALDATGYRGG
uniref:SGNH/GDSL hydrolase family protein n=2 Tax=Streptomyces TaxID=1883 RepID=A0AAU2GRV6_9ACTN